MPAYVTLTAIPCAQPSCVPSSLRPHAQPSSLALQLLRAEAVRLEAEQPLLADDFADIVRVFDRALDDVHQRAVALRVAR